MNWPSEKRPEKPSLPVVVRWFLRLLPTLRPEAACAYGILLVYVAVVLNLPAMLVEDLGRTRYKSGGDEWGTLIVTAVVGLAGCIGLLLPWIAMLGGRVIYGRLGVLVCLTNTVLLAIIVGWAANDHLVHGIPQHGSAPYLAWGLAAISFFELFIVIYGGSRFLDLSADQRCAYLGLDKPLQPGLWCWEMLLVIALVFGHWCSLISLSLPLFALLTVHVLAISAMAWIPNWATSPNDSATHR